MSSFSNLVFIYIIGGVTFVPLLLCLVLLHAYLTFPLHSASSPDLYAIRDPNDDGHNIKSDTAISNLAKQFRRNHEPDVAAGYFAVCREYVPGGINGKPPERTTPAGIVAAESPSVYQSMYRSIFDKKQGPTIEPGKANGKTFRRARNVFYVVLRHGHLMLYDDIEQMEVRHVISLEHHDVSIYNGGEDIPEGELWIKRNAIQLSRKHNAEEVISISKPFFLFSENCSEKEDFYFALLQNQEVKPDSLDNPPRPQQYDVKHIITLVQKLHSSEEQLQTKWINGIIGRGFLALYKTPEVEDFVRKKITKKIARVKKPAFLSGIVLQKIDMGESAPYITNPRLKDLTVDGDCCAEVDFKYSGNFRLEVAATARIDLGTRFKAREVNLVLAVVVKKLEGHALIRFKPAPSNRVWIAFETMPEMDMTIEPIVSSRQITYNIILRQIESRIKEVIAETLVLPNWDDMPFTNTMHQKFRGGIWADSQADAAASTPHTAIPDDEAQDELDAGPVPSDSPRSKDERTINVPVFADTMLPIPGLNHRKTSSTQSMFEKVDEGASTGGQKRPDPPRAMRSNSFASAAKPVVSMDTANVNAKKQYKDATSAIKAISNRSQPTSPTDTPFGSPPETPTLWENSKSRPSSSTSLTRNGTSEESPTASIPRSLSQTSVPATPSSMNSRSSKLAFGSEEQYRTSTQSDARSSASSERRQPIASIGAATAAAKNWGWNVLARGKEQMNHSNHASDPNRAGTPEHPIGRGRPLPPPGQPLPFPERPSTKLSQSGSAKKKPLPPPLLPQRRQDETKRRPVQAPPPPLPNRRKQEPTAEGDAGDEGLMVVEAPPESEPATPIEDSHGNSIGPMDLYSAEGEKTPSANHQIKPPPPQPTVTDEEPHKERKAPGLHEGDGSLLGKLLAQREEAQIY